MVKVSKDNAQVEGSAIQVARPRTQEAAEKPERRHFTAEYKADILKRVDACKGEGDVGKLLRKEGLYSSILSSWRKQRDAGGIVALGPRKRGRKPLRHDPLAVENERLRRENGQLQNRLRQAEIIISVQKKVSELLGIPMATTDDENEKNE
jgi:transposase-like protein